MIMERVKYSDTKEDGCKKKLTPEKVVSLLGRHGTKVSLEDAETILEFMRKIADVAVNQYLSIKKD